MGSSTNNEAALPAPDTTPGVETNGVTVVNVPEDPYSLNSQQTAVAVREVDQTSGLPIANSKARIVTMPVGVTGAEFKTALLAASLVYDGVMLHPEDIERIAGLSKLTVKRLFDSREFQNACELRGTPTFKKAGLSDRQLMAIHFLLDVSTPTLAGRLRNAGITMKEYNLWRRNPAFKAELARLGQKVLEDNEQDMLTTLAGLSVNGDQRAIELVFNMTGKHNPQTKQLADMQTFVAAVLEVIKSEVKDTETLQRIASKLALHAAAAAPPPPPLKEITSG